MMSVKVSPIRISSNALAARVKPTARVVSVFSSMLKFDVVERALVLKSASLGVVFSGKYQVETVSPASPNSNFRTSR
jgi:hypothetical protein